MSSQEIQALDMHSLVTYGGKTGRAFDLVAAIAQGSVRLGNVVSELGEVIASVLVAMMDTVRSLLYWGKRGLSNPQWVRRIR